MAESTDLMNPEASLASLVAEAATQNPDGIAFITGSRQRSWSQVADDVARKASLLGQMGFPPADRIAVLAGSNEAHVELTFILAWAGITVVPLNTRLSLAEHIQILNDADVTAVIHDDMLADRAAAAAGEAGIARVYAAASILDHDIASIAPVAPYAWRAGDLAAILYTGGTTGRAKGVRMPVSSFMVHGRNVRKCLGYNRESVVLHTQPIFHVSGCNQLYGLVQAGGTLVFRGDVGPAATYEEIRDHGVNSVGMVPTALAQLLNFPGRSDALLHKVRSFVYGAASITETLLAQAIAAMPNAGFCQFYGMTESGPVTALLPEDHVLSGPRAGKLKTAGRPRSHIRLRVADSEGNDVPVGVPGEILLAGEGLCDGYWRAPERTAELFRDGWLRTGDAGVLDADGYLSIVDRYKDMIVTGGENVFCAEVEHVLAAHPAVEACSVFGVPDPFWGEAVCASVLLKQGHSADSAALIAFCKERIAGYKCPKSFDFRSEPLPVSGVGKVLKHILREEVAARPCNSPS